MTQDEASDHTDVDADGEERHGNVLRRLGARVVERMPAPPDLLALVLWFVAGVTMAPVLLAPEVGGRLGDLDLLAGVAAFVGAACFVMRLRLLGEAGALDDGAPMSKLELATTAAAFEVIEGVLFFTIGRLAFTMWAIAAAWTLLGWRRSVRAGGKAALPASDALRQLLVAGLGFGALLAVGLDLRGTDATTAEFLSSPITVGAMLSAASIGVGVGWGRAFERHVAANEERAWLLWIFWPSAGAMGFTYLAREDYPLWMVLALTAATLATIMGHALFATQRPRAPRADAAPDAAAAFGISSDADHVPGTPPTGVLRELVEVLPGATALVVGLLLAVAGAVS